MVYPEDIKTTKATHAPTKLETKPDESNKMPNIVSLTEGEELIKEGSESIETGLHPEPLKPEKEVKVKPGESKEETLNITPPPISEEMENATPPPKTEYEPKFKSFSHPIYQAYKVNINKIFKVSMTALVSGVTF